MIEIDNDGYPTDETLEYIKMYDGYSDYNSFIQEIAPLFSWHGRCEYLDEILKIRARVKELEIRHNRLLTLATKWCDVNHRDWEEVLEYNYEGQEKE